MKRLSYGHWIGFMAPVLVGTACSTGPTDEDYDDVATSVGALTASDSGGEMGSMDDSVVLAEGESPDGTTASGSGSYEGSRLGLEYEYAVTCSDANGALMSLCDGSTDSAHVVVDWSGRLDLPRYSASIARTGDWTLSGLQSEVAQFDGHGTWEVDSEFEALYRPVTRSFHLDFDALYTGVRVRRADRVVEAGEIRYDVHAERTRTDGDRTREAEFDIEAVLTFDGIGATLVLDGSRTYSVDLASGAVVRQ